MSDDFCLIHGYEHMKAQFGNPIPYCAACDSERERVARQEAAWLLLHRWENVAKNGGEKWLRDHPLVAETTKLLNDEAAASSTGDSEPPRIEP